MKIFFSQILVFTVQTYQAKTEMGRKRDCKGVNGVEYWKGVQFSCEGGGSTNRFILWITEMKFVYGS
jgi:hypothetical protein